MMDRAERGLVSTTVGSCRSRPLQRKEDLVERSRFKRRWILLGSALGGGVSGVVLWAFMMFAGTGLAASTAKPENTSPPTVTGVVQDGKTLTGDRGDWSGSPSDFDVMWLRCDKNGGSCSTISGAFSTKYTLKSVDVGNTLRFRVHAQNADGTTAATSVPTAVVVAAGSDKPVNTSPPKISGTPQQGKTLTGDRGDWDNKPTDFDDAWLRCGKNGGSCSTIAGSAGTKYTLTSADVGNTIRFRVQAKNSGGTTTATSVPTAAVSGATPAPASRPNGCPPSDGADQVSAISPPARLLVDTLQSDPRVVTRGTNTLVMRFHVTSTCGGPVQGAIVYATATPFNQFAIPSEARTSANGWAELRFARLAGFPVSGKQQLIALFVRARKPGEALLGGISTRRLMSIRVALSR